MTTITSAPEEIVRGTARASREVRAASAMTALAESFALKSCARGEWIALAMACAPTGRAHARRCGKALHAIFQSVRGAAPTPSGAQKMI